MILNYNYIYDNQVYDWDKTDNCIFESLVRFTDLLGVLDISKPWHIYITLLNAKGYRSSNFYSGDTEPIDRHIIHSTECILNEDQKLETSLKATFDSLANAFGISKSPNYKENGDYIIRK